MYERVKPTWKLTVMLRIEGHYFESWPYWDLRVYNGFSLSTGWMWLKINVDFVKRG